MTSPAREVSPAVSALLRIVAFFAAALLLATWPLWAVSSQEHLQIPWWSGLCGSSRWIDLSALLALVSGLTAMGWGRGSPRSMRVALALFTTGLFVLVACDQHRLQPWVCQFLLFGVLFLIAPNRLGVDCWKVIVASIYLWSAVSKIDCAFLSSHGELLLAGMLDPLGVDFQFWAPRTKLWLAALFPAGEMLIGLLLLFRSTRRYGLPASLLMHLLLLWTLGVGLKHDWGVLIWNLFFIVQNIFLYGPDCFPRKSRKEEGDVPSSVVRYAALGFTVLAATYPALELGHLCDHWPAWAVYSSRPAQVKILIDQESARLLPDSLTPYLGTPAPLDDRVPLSLEAWSFQQCRCPVYPQLRYRLGLAVALLESHIPQEAVTVEIASSPDRWTGQRQQFQLDGIPAIKKYSERFWFNIKQR